MPLISGFPPACSIYASNLDSNELQTLPGCRLPQEAAAIEDLYDWSLNFNAGRNPYCVFIDLIGYSIEEWGVPAFPDTHDYRGVLGYIELCMLADALKVFDENGYDQVYAWCRALNESED